MRTSVYNSIITKPSLAVVARATDEAFEGTAVDRAEFKNYARAASVVVFAGAVTDGSHVISLEVSNNDSDWVTATAAMGLQGTAPTLDEDSDDGVFEFGYTGPERYLRVVSTATGTTTGGIYGALVLLGDVRRKPVARS